MQGISIYSCRDTIDAVVNVDGVVGAVEEIVINWIKIETLPDHQLEVFREILWSLLLRYPIVNKDPSAS